MALRLLVSGLALFGLGSAAPAQVQKRLLSTVQEASSPVSIDRSGIYVRGAHLLDGSLVAGYAVTEGTDKFLRVAQSTDAASSWTVIGTVSSRVAATSDLDNADLIQLPNGRILYAFRNHDKATSDGKNYHYTWYRLTVCYSDDGGKTWGYLSQIEERAANGVNGLWEPFLRIAADGSTVQVYYSSENGANDQDNLMKYSTDGGATWVGPITVSGAGVTVRDGMTGVATRNDGSLICVFETTEIGLFSVDRVISTDDGHTWGQRARVYTAANGKNAGSPQVINVGGTIVTSFMTNENTDTATIDDGQMKVVTSVDGGNTWSNSGGGGFVTADKGSHWPGMLTTSSTEFLALYTKDGLGAVSQYYKLV